MFKKKYGIEKMTLITLTDGGANGIRGRVKGSERNEYGSDWHKTEKVYNIGKKRLQQSRHSDGENLTAMLLNHIKSEHNVNVIGFFLLKRIRKWDLERMCKGKDYYEREKEYAQMRKQMTKDKAVAVDKTWYNKYFILNGKTMDVENFSMA